MGKARPISVSMTPEIVRIIDELESLYIKLGKRKSRSSIIAELIKISYPTLKRRLNDELARENAKYDEPFDRFMKDILFDWKREVL